MKEVYSPANAAEAHMLAHMLDEHGIAAHVMGEQLQGGVGELPAGGFIKLMVADEDHAKARELILAWEREQTETPASETFSPKRRFPIFTAIVFFLIGGLAGGLGNSLLSVAPGLASDTQEYDQNGDGQVDLRYVYSASATSPYRAEGDNNFDGRMDWIMTIDPQTNAMVSQRADQDFDGEFETHYQYRDGVLALEDINLDKDGAPDITTEFVRGVVERVQLTDPATRRVVRTDFYQNLVLVRAEIDLDRDGFAETLRSFDRFGEITSEETRQRPAN